MPVEVPDSVLEKFRRVGTATVYGVVRKRGWENCTMRHVRPITPGRKLVGRARTLLYLPPREDLLAELPKGEESPEYVAMGSCGPGDVLVASVGSAPPWTSIGGDVKFFQLKMNGAEGIVTDGAIRDSERVADYGLALYARDTTSGIGSPSAVPYRATVDVQVDAVLVRPGDVIVADSDGVVVVPSHWAQEVADACLEVEAVEEYIKERVLKERCAPGRYYPPTEEFVAEFRRAKGR